MNINLDLCKSEKTIDGQMSHIYEEYIEARAALYIYQTRRREKDRAEVLFELLDTINATQTALCMMFTEEEIIAGCKYVNAKNFVRHYLKDSEADSEVKEQES